MMTFNYEHITREMMTVLDDHGYDYSVGAVETIMNRWFTAKRPLIDILSNHPQWNAEKFMVQFDADYIRDVESNVAYEFFRWLYTPYAYDGWNAPFNPIKTAIACMMDCCCNTYLNERDAQYIERLNEMHESFRFRVGMKSTRVVRKVCDTFELSKLDGFEHRYAMYCDAVTPLAIKRHTCLSVNPIDYLLMSYGNSWRSCHAIHDHAGEYSSGTISYMLDDVSMVFYTVDGSFNGRDIERERKIQRQMFMYENGMLLQSRLYPSRNDGDDAKYTEIRAIVQKVMADSLELPNLWKRLKSFRAEKHRDATLYPDFNYGNAIMTVLSNYDDVDIDHKMIIGRPPICVNCGREHEYSENIVCCDISTFYCEDCGRELRDGVDHIYWIDGSPYCSDCTVYCEECGEVVHCDDAEWVDTECVYICHGCLEWNYTQCEHCGEYVRNDDGYSTTFGIICEYCCDRHYAYCEHCNTYVPRDLMDDVTDMCADCRDQFEELNNADADEV